LIASRVTSSTAFLSIFAWVEVTRGGMGYFRLFFLLGGGIPHIEGVFLHSNPGDYDV